jgi:hypothetical protein
MLQVFQTSNPKPQTPTPDSDPETVNPKQGIGVLQQQLQDGGGFASAKNALSSVRRTLRPVSKAFSAFHRSMTNLKTPKGRLTGLGEDSDGSSSSMSTPHLPRLPRVEVVAAGVGGFGWGSGVWGFECV